MANCTAISRQRLTELPRPIPRSRLSPRSRRGARADRRRVVAQQRVRVERHLVERARRAGRRPPGRSRPSRRPRASPRSRRRPSLPVASTNAASGTTPSSRGPSAGSSETTRARYARWCNSSGAERQRASPASRRAVGRDRRPLQRGRRRRTASRRSAGRGPGRCSGRRGPPRSSPAGRASSGPAAPWEIVPAKKMPGTEALSQYGVWAGSRLWPNVVTPRSGRSSSGATKPVAAITSSTSNRQLVAAAGRSGADLEAAASSRSIRPIAASRIATPPPRTWSSTGWT